MANVKITDLNAYTDPDSTDVLPIVDVTSDETKKVSIADLLENAGSGAEATPGIAFDGDPNTGIYRPGADQIAISTGGTKRLEISATGAVTIPGDLTVQGTTTFIDSTTLRVEDKNIELGYVGTPTDTTADGGGITLKGATDKTINWVNATDAWTSSERFDFPTGTAAAPSVILNGDVNSGLYQPGADQVAIATGGTGRLFVDSSGRVGIGTSPSFPLHVSSTGTVAQIESTNSAPAELRLKTSIRDWTSYVDTTGDFVVRDRTGSSERLRIDTSGRLGVGTSSPDSVLTARDEGGTDLATLRLEAYRPALRFIDINSSTADAEIVANGGSIAFNIGLESSPSTLLSEKVRIDSSGRLGVGTSSPEETLDVDGPITWRGSLASSKTSAGALDRSGNDLRIRAYGATAGTGQLVFRTGGGGGSVDSESARIDSSGRLGVGTSSPSAKLDVQGGAIFDDYDSGATPSTSGISVTGGFIGISRANTAGTAIRVRNNTGDALLLNTNGSAYFANNVGIGTSSVDELLHVESSGTNPRVKIQSTGTNSYPGVRLTNDARTYDIQIDGATDGLRVYDATAASQRVRIDSSGRVGIGSTVTPDSYLHVWGGVGKPGMRIGYSDNSNYFDSDYFIVRNTAGSERLRIDSSGRLGVGTSAPSSLMHLQTTSANVVLQMLENNGSTVYGASIDAFNSSGGNIRLRLHDSGGTYQERLRITSTGNVGIGTTSPSSNGLVTIAETTNARLYLTDSTLGSNYGAQLRGYGVGGVGGYAELGVVDNNSYRKGITVTAQASDVIFNTGTSEKARIDSSGRLGVGTSSPGTDLDVNSSSANCVIRARAGSGYSSSLNLLPNGSGSGLELTANSDLSAKLINQQNSSLIFGTNYTERMRVDNVGRLLVGTSTASGPPRVDIVGNSSSSTGSGVLQLRRGSNASSDGTELGYLAFGDTISGGYQRALVAAYADGAGGTGDLPTRLSFWTTPDGSATPGERMRIASTGETELYTNTSFNLRTNRTSGLTAALNVYKGATSISSGTLCCQIRADGDLLNTNNSYGSLSDVKLKENIVDANSQWDDLKAIQVRNYNFKEGQTHTQLGVVAQEVELVSPGLVRDTPDTDQDGNDLGTTTKSVNYSVLYMKAVKALQEAMERIETLEAKVAALEGN